MFKCLKHGCDRPKDTIGSFRLRMVSKEDGNFGRKISYAHAQTDFPPKITVLFAYRPQSKAP